MKRIDRFQSSIQMYQIKIPWCRECNGEHTVNFGDFWWKFDCPKNSNYLKSIPLQNSILAVLWSLKPLFHANGFSTVCFTLPSYFKIFRHRCYWFHDFEVRFPSEIWKFLKKWKPHGPWWATRVPLFKIQFWMCIWVRKDIKLYKL